MKEETLHFSDARLLSHLYANDLRNIDEAERTLGVSLVTRDDWLRIQGELESVTKATALFKLLEAARHHGIRACSEPRHLQSTAPASQLLSTPRSGHSGHGGARGGHGGSGGTGGARGGRGGSGGSGSNSQSASPQQQSSLRWPRGSLKPSSLHPVYSTAEGGGVMTPDEALSVPGTFNSYEPTE